MFVERDALAWRREGPRTKTAQTRHNAAGIWRI